MSESRKTTLIAQAIRDAAERGLTKPLDVAIAIKTQLRKQGLRIVRIPNHQRKEG